MPQTFAKITVFVTNLLKVARLEVLKLTVPKLRRSDDRWNMQFQN